MRKPVKMVVIALIGLVVLIQFFQPERNLDKVDTESDLLIVTMAPDSLSSIFTSSCYDCHSDHTDYPWYSYVSPVSWLLEKHIRNGRKKLNLSNFGNLEPKQKIGAFTDICEVLESGSMPLKSYLLIHRDARVSKEEVESICNWSESEALQLMRK